jgi:hypothetical protein
MCRSAKCGGNADNCPRVPLTGAQMVVLRTDDITMIMVSVHACVRVNIFLKTLLVAPSGPCPIINVPAWSNAQRVSMTRTLDPRCFLDPNMPRISSEVRAPAGSVRVMYVAQVDPRCVQPLVIASDVPDVVRCWQVCCEYGYNGEAHAHLCAHSLVRLNRLHNHDLLRADS